MLRRIRVCAGDRTFVPHKKKRIKGQSSWKSQPVTNVVFLLTAILMVLFAISMLVPVCWTFISSFKDAYDFLYNPFSLPDRWMFSNYSDAWNHLEVEILVGREIMLYTYGNMFFYSMVITVSLTVICSIYPVLVAYATARYRFRGRNLLYSLSIIVMTVPIVGNLASNLTIRRALGLYDNLIPFLLTSGGGFGFNTILLHGIFRGFTDSYGEAAKIDGAGHFLIMFRIYIPMIMPTVTALAVMSFMGTWNDYMLCVMYLPSYPNLAYGTYLFNAFAAVKQYSVPMVMAAFILVSIPTIILWTVTQKFVVGKVMIGGLKG